MSQKSGFNSDDLSITMARCVIHRHPFNYTGYLWTEKSSKDYSG